MWWDIGPCACKRCFDMVHVSGRACYSCAWKLRCEAGTHAGLGQVSWACCFSGPRDRHLEPGICTSGQGAIALVILQWLACKVAELQRAVRHGLGTTDVGGHVGVGIEGMSGLCGKASWSGEDGVRCMAVLDVPVVKGQDIGINSWWHRSLSKWTVGGNAVFQIGRYFCPLGEPSQHTVGSPRVEAVCTVDSTWI
jgi:hypothetical protein